MKDDKILCTQDFKDNAGNLIFRKGEYYVYIYHKHNHSIILYTHDDWELPLKLNLDENFEKLKNYFILPSNVKRIAIIKNLIKSEYKSEYEAYMKVITDNFINMQSDNIVTTMGRDEDIAYKEVVWDGKSINFEFQVNPHFYLNGISFEEMKKHNSVIAKHYLDTHSLTYEKWIKRFKNI